MTCPTCQHRDSEVIDSRQQNDIRYRRHKCGKCGYRFATYELTAEHLGRIEAGGSLDMRKKLANLKRLLDAAYTTAETSVFSERGKND